MMTRLPFVTGQRQRGENQSQQSSENEQGAKELEP